MMEIWGGIESFKDIAPIEMPARHDAGKLLNGPKIEGDVGHASQDDIDALFG
jgi:chemotaxis protein CheZ